MKGKSNRLEGGDFFFFKVSGFSHVVQNLASFKLTQAASKVKPALKSQCYVDLVFQSSSFCYKIKEVME